MSEQVRYTLIGDGSSDRCLIPVINWLLGQIPALRAQGFVAQFADLRTLKDPVSGLKERMEIAYRQFPCEVLFVHRDAEGASLERRIQEIHQAAQRADLPSYVPLVPVRMTEAWLFDERAIRSAADNPNGVEPLPIPAGSKLEAISNPKDLLHQCLVIASEKRGRRLQQFRRDLPVRVHRIADLIRDFSSLRSLTAFVALETAVQESFASFLPVD